MTVFEIWIFFVGKMGVVGAGAFIAGLSLFSIYIVRIWFLAVHRGIKEDELQERKEIQRKHLFRSLYGHDQEEE